MPPRLARLGIVIAWLIATSLLFFRDLLPELLVGEPPDFTAIIPNEEEELEGPVTWTITVNDEKEDGSADPRIVGMAITETTKQADGFVRLSSKIRFDSGKLLQGTPLANTGGEELEINSTIDVDPMGNLSSLQSSVRGAAEDREVLVIEGQLEEDQLVINARSPMLRLINWSKSFPYEPRQIVQNAVAPVDRLPDLRVGKRWKTRAVSPITGQAVEAVAEVTSQNVMMSIGNAMVPTFVVETEFGGPPPLGGITARTWVRASDGLVIQQEVPLVIVKLLLTRELDSGDRSSE